MLLGAAGHHAAVGEPDQTVSGDAFELFMAEAARLRLCDRGGEVRIELRSGARLVGRLVPENGDGVDRHLCLVDGAGRTVLVATDSILMIAGASAGLRDESASRSLRSLASRLREAWGVSPRLRVLISDGRWLDGRVALVAADHVELAVAGEMCVIPCRSVEAWVLPT